MEPAVGAWCTGSEVCFRLHDENHRLSGVRLRAGVIDGAPEFSYDAATRAWQLRLPRPPVWRIEYQLELSRPDGDPETVPDPDNPLRVGGAFGDSSELRCPDYAEPQWLQHPPAPGDWRELYLPMPAVKGEAVARVWSPVKPTPHVVVAHDGPDYHRYAELGRYSAAMVGAGLVSPHHLVLLPPGERMEWYSASPAYARGLTRDVLPKVGAELGIPGLGSDRGVVGVGASLGALAMLHAQRRHPAAFAGLFLQSGSFFQPRFDRQESGFGRWLRIVRFTGRVLRDAGGPAVPVALTCGAPEENLANNRDMAAALRRHGYPVTFAELPDGHQWTGWRDGLDPHLTALLQRVF
jgi:enterochelin esterase-like enzyme